MCNLQDTMCIVQYIIHIVCYPLTICISTMFNGSQPFWNEPTNYPYFAFWSASTNLLSHLKWTIDLIHRSDTLIWSIDLIHSDFVQQVRLLHCCALRREDRGSYNIFVFVFVFASVYVLYFRAHRQRRHCTGGSSVLSRAAGATFHHRSHTAICS